jgi:hypothetical protein
MGAIKENYHIDLTKLGFGLYDGGVSVPDVTPDEIADNTFYADMQDEGTFSYVSLALDQIINKSSIGTTYSEIVTNGTFDANVTGWTLSSSTLAWDATGGGSMKITNTAATNGRGFQNLTTVAGTVYRVRVSFIGGTSTTSRVILRDLITPGDFVDITKTGSTSEFDIQFIAPSTSVRLSFLLNAVSGATLFVDYASVKQVDAATQGENSFRPTVVSDGINGKTALQFDGVNDYMKCGKAVVGNSYTKFITFKYDPTYNTNQANLISSPTAGAHSLWMIIPSGSLGVFRASVNQGNLTYNMTNLDSFNAMTLIETFNSGTGTKKLYVNGVEVATGTTTKTFTDFSFILGGYGSAGTAGAPASTELFKGYIGDFGTYNRVLTADEISQIDEHQRKRYRVPATSSTHILISSVSQSNSVGFAVDESDSVASGNGLNYIPSIRHYRETNDITGESYSASSDGSHWPPLCAELKSLSSRVPVFVSCGKTATSINDVNASGGADTHWGTGSDLRNNFKTNTDAMLQYFTRTNLDFCVFNIGERDVSQAGLNKAQWKAAALDLIDWVKSQYPGVKIILIQTVLGRDAGDNPADQALWEDITEAQQELAAEQSNVFLDQSNVGFTKTNGRMEADGIHYTKAGNLIVGESVAALINDNL